MQVFIALLWIFLVLAALILPVLMIIWVWGRIRLMLNQVGNTAERLGYTASKADGKYHLSFTLRNSGVKSSVEDILSAKAMRKEIREKRYAAKQRRLAVAKSRWEKLGLV